MAHAGGRPKKEIDKDQFEKLCGLQCTILEMCDYFDVDDKTLSKWCKDTYGKSFSEIFKIKRGRGLISLRRHQWNLAEKNSAMAIFLGKNYLGQKDAFEETHNVQNGILDDLVGALNKAKESK